jgi:mono/diheme cytochrome c family protein
MKRTILILGLLFLTLAACSSPADEPASASTARDLELGATVFQANCSACHATKNEDKLVGPSMIGLVERAGNAVAGLDSRAYIEESILDPAAYLNEGYPNVMPNTYGSSLSEEQLNAVIAYLMTFD